MALYDIESFEKAEELYYQEILLHFQSDELAAKYLRGLIDWNGEEIV